MSISNLISENTKASQDLNINSLNLSKATFFLDYNNGPTIDIGSVQCGDIQVSNVPSIGASGSILINVLSDNYIPVNSIVLLTKGIQPAGDAASILNVGINSETSGAFIIYAFNPSAIIFPANDPINIQFAIL